MTVGNACPRCGGAIPNASTPGAYPGALSRRDNATEICSDCGMREALEDYARAIGSDDPNRTAAELLVGVKEAARGLSTT